MSQFSVGEYIARKARLDNEMSVARAASVILIIVEAKTMARIISPI